MSSRVKATSWSHVPTPQSLLCKLLCLLLGVLSLLWHALYRHTRQDFTPSALLPDLQQWTLQDPDILFQPQWHNSGQVFRSEHTLAGNLKETVSDICIIRVVMWEITSNHENHGWLLVSIWFECDLSKFILGSFVSQCGSFQVVGPWESYLRCINAFLIGPQTSSCKSELLGSADLTPEPLSDFIIHPMSRRFMYTLMRRHPPWSDKPETHTGISVMLLSTYSPQKCRRNHLSFVRDPPSGTLL